MKVLLVGPECPETFWSFKHALQIISRKALLPPLGLLTVAAMLPPAWHKKLVDMSVRPLRDKDIAWADYVFISAMRIHKESVDKVVTRCKRLGARIVAGGPLLTAGYERAEEIDHLVLDEAEITLPSFLHRPASRAGGEMGRNRALCGSTGPGGRLRPNPPERQQIVPRGHERPGDPDSSGPRRYHMGRFYRRS